jgi:flagellar biosynthesis protein FlhG
MAQIWPIGGGKGGTGKSFITANTGVLLARQRFRTLLIDADLGAANLHTLVGLSRPERSLSDFINRKVPALSDTVLETPVPNLFLISGAGNKLDIANLAYEQKARLLRAILRLDYHYILLDLSSGTSFNTIDFFTLSDSGIFVCCPELTSIENFYSLIRSVYLRKIRQVLKLHHFVNLSEKAEERTPDAIVNRPEYLLDVLKEIDSEKGRMIEEILQGFQFRLVLNQVRKQDSPETGALICRIVQKHLGLKVQFLGNVAFDENVRDDLRKRGPFVDKCPYCRAAMDLKALSRALAGTSPAEASLPHPDVANTVSGAAP